MQEVSAAIIVDKSRILICRRAPNQKLAGYWEFAGGKREDNESIEDCLVRELMEELKVTVNVTGILGSSEYLYDGGAIRLVGVEADLSAGDIILSVHDAYEWAPIHELGSFDLAPADIALADMVRRKYGKASDR